VRTGISASNIMRTQSWAPALVVAGLLLATGLHLSGTGGAPRRSELQGLVEYEPRAARAQPLGELVGELGNGDPLIAVRGQGLFAAVPMQALLSGQQVYISVAGPSCSPGASHYGA
jgi:hypothetical protein